MIQDNGKFSSLEEMAKSVLGDSFSREESSANQTERLLVPRASVRKVGSSASVDNFNLRLNKYLTCELRNRKDSLAKINFSKFERPNFKNIEKFIKSLLFAQKEAAVSLTKPGELLSDKIMATTWRLAIGLGTESVLETSMTLHHIYGFPYIPGQAFKAAIRSYVINMYFGNEDEAFKSNDFCTLFGAGENGINKEQAGALIFFDVYPLRPPKVVKDIMNPHFGEYYKEGGTIVPGDYYDPVPVNFLTVIDTSYNFMVGIKKGKEIKLKEDVFGKGTVLGLVSDWIKNSLSIFGIGAKTAVGYGRFQ